MSTCPPYFHKLCSFQIWEDAEAKTSFPAQISQYEEIKKMKEQKIRDSVARGNPSDDVKSASNDICTYAKKILELTACGNSGEMIMRDTLAKLISSDMDVYKELEKTIFGDDIGK